MITNYAVYYKKFDRVTFIPCLYFKIKINLSSSISFHVIPLHFLVYCYLLSTSDNNL